MKGVSDFHRFERVADTIVSSIERSYADFTGDLSIKKSQQLRAPLPDEESLHLIQRKKMLHLMKKVEETYEDCLTNVESFNSVVGNWYKCAKAILIQPNYEVLASNMVKMQNNLHAAETALADTIREFKIQLIQLEKVIAQISTSIQSFQRAGSANGQAVRARLLEVTKVQNEMQSRLEQNSDLCDQLHGIIKSLSGPSP